MILLLTVNGELVHGNVIGSNGLIRLKCSTQHVDIYFIELTCLT